MEKRELAARVLELVGLTAVLERALHSPALIVLTYHRVGDSKLTPYDSGTFSATADGLYEQIRMFKRQRRIVSLAEAIDALAAARARPERMILLTFDDGYLDNLTIAAPILQACDAPAVFFLVTDFLTAGTLPWWDEIAFIIKHARRRRFSLNYPTVSAWDVSDGTAATVRNILRIYKSPAVTEPERFIRGLEDACGCNRPGPDHNLFMDWNGARSLKGFGIDVGSHTVTHRVLSKLTESEQEHEAAESKRLLEVQLGRAVSTFAYPVGTQTAFTAVTKAAVVKAGYAVAFSFHDGVSHWPVADMYDVPRFGIDAQKPPRLRLQLATCGHTRKFF